MPEDWGRDSSLLCSGEHSQRQNLEIQVEWCNYFYAHKMSAALRFAFRSSIAALRKRLAWLKVSAKIETISRQFGSASKKTKDPIVQAARSRPIPGLKPRGHISTQNWGNSLLVARSWSSKVEGILKNASYSVIRVDCRESWIWREWGQLRVLTPVETKLMNHWFSG